MNRFVLLSRRGLIAVSGPEARAFLQGLVTVDILGLAPGKPRHAALLSPQGRFLHDFFLLDDGGRILVDVEKSRLLDLLSRFKLYRLRADVQLEEVKDIAVFALLGGMKASPPAGMIVIDDPRFAPLGSRAYGVEKICREFFAAQGMQEAGENEYDTHRMKSGIPDSSRDLIVERSLIMECGFPELGGVDFTKGCYVGQEVTARMKYRANLRKQFYLVQAESELPPPGTEVIANEKSIGELRSHVGNRGLAILNNEAVKSGQKLTAGNVLLKASLPPWAAENEGEISGGESA